MGNKHMTIYDIAKLAGVSASSVSRVINGKPGVNKEKRKLIEDLLREHNYVPDANARSLVHQNSHTIGILTDDIETMHLTISKSKIEHELMSSGYYCFSCLISGPEEIEKGVRTLAGLRVEGAVFMGLTFRHTEKVRDALERYLPNTPVVMMHHQIPDLPNIYMVGVNQRMGFSNAVTFLHGKGRRHFALLVNESRYSSTVIRSGFNDGVRAHPGTTSVLYTGISDSVEAGEAAAETLFREHPETDAMICTSDLIAIGALNYLERSGIAVPERVSLMGEDNSPYCATCRPPLSSLDNMLPVSSVLVARTLMDAVAGRVPNRQTILEIEIAERQTT